MTRTILVIDDEAAIRDSLKGALTDEGYRVLTAESGKAALETIPGKATDVILLDIWMPDMDGLETLKRIRALDPQRVVIMMSGHGTIVTAVRATKAGAFDFIEKPLSLEKLLVLLKNAFSVQDLSRENQALRTQVKRNATLLGTSSAIQTVKDMIERVAPTTGSVLITGENGTGKELVAQSIHSRSPRFDKPFVEVNCAAIPEELIESELFGHEKGSFTGATQMRWGKFDLANGGTLFLDEIGDMSLKTQAKILRILQEQKFERVGGTETISVDVRVVAATNKNLKEEIAKGHFREDLFYRLNVIPFQIPALRDRKQDIPILAAHFMEEFSRTHHRAQRTLSPEATKVLLDYPWPGNVRELKNLIERLIILTPSYEDGKPVTAAHLFELLQNEPTSPGMQTTDYQQFVAKTAARNLKDARLEFEKEFILKALEENQGNISKTAQALGVERSHLHRKIKSFES
jgi:two-component system nitrogen regulation response regulator NtrX